MHVEDVAILNALDDADRNVDERVFMKYKQPIVGQGNDAVGARPTEVLHTLAMQLLERYSEPFLVTLDRFLGIYFADEYSLQCILIGSNATATTAARHYTATAVYLKTHHIIAVSLSFIHSNINGSGRLGWARFNVPLDTFLGHFGDGGVAAALARITATVRAHSVCGVE